MLIILKHLPVIIILNMTFPKKIAVTDSLLTSLTKENPLLVKSPEQKQDHHKLATVFISHEQQLYSVKLAFGEMTIRQLTSKAAKEMSRQYDIKMQKISKHWALYPSRKSGKICSDYPCLQPTQKAQLTGFNCFHLSPENPLLVSSSGKITTEMVTQKKKEIKSRESKSCLCIFGF